MSISCHRSCSCRQRQFEYPDENVNFLFHVTGLVAAGEGKFECADEDVYVQTLLRLVARMHRDWPGCIAAAVRGLQGSQARYIAFCWLRCLPTWLPYFMWQVHSIICDSGVGACFGPPQEDTVAKIGVAVFCVNARSRAACLPLWSAVVYGSTSATNKRGRKALCIG